MASTVFNSFAHFVIVMRVYRLWDRRKEIKWILIVAFTTAMSVAAAFAVLSLRQLDRTVTFTPALDMCTISTKPESLKFCLAALTAFDLFIIVMTIFNALDRPHRHQADVMTALQNDGARMFVCLFRAPNVLKIATVLLTYPSI
ncbi:unnamed protein product [Mycena citricolor]|uniref:Uncharacterized protein n=1 Tax=Mycena citricolor TaxID=2018698 RepID=A0AAD2I209_9AGAR|nr:unnamed protein product [Mycena citricolor]